MLRSWHRVRSAKASVVDSDASDSAPTCSSHPPRATSQPTAYHFERKRLTALRKEWRTRVVGAATASRCLSSIETLPASAQPSAGGQARDHATVAERPSRRSDPSVAVRIASSSPIFCSRATGSGSGKCALIVYWLRRPFRSRVM